MERYQRRDILVGLAGLVIYLVTRVSALLSRRQPRIPDVLPPAAPVVHPTAESSVLVTALQEGASHRHADAL